jgi:hypothetical protein
VRWNGSRWSLLRGPPGSLEFVSCFSPTACIVSGYRRGTPTMYRWDGKRWLTEPAPPAVDGMWCASVNHCVAPVIGPNHWWIANWNGHRWSVRKFPAPRGSFFLPTDDPSRSDGWSCLSATNCWAAGAVGRMTQVVHWDRRHLSMPHLPPNPGTVSAEFHGISCGRTVGCVAVGEALTPFSLPWTALVEALP